jgi:hypothetical protein
MTEQSNTTPNIFQRLIDILKIISATLLLFFLVDFFAGNKLMALVRPAEPFRTWHPVYHHTLKPNYDGMGHWGDWAYRVCTNSEGFKVSCNKKPLLTKSFDVAFMGDSFTEGLGLPYEQTFVGIVADQMPDLKIANLGVVSYSPAIYLVKLKELLAQGYSFKHIIIFVDISDPYDEANRYDLHNDIIVVDRGEPYPLPTHSRLRRIASQHLPLTGEAYKQFRQAISQQAKPGQATLKTPQEGLAPAVPQGTTDSISAPNSVKADTVTQPKRNLYDTIYQRDYAVGEWTYNVQSTNFGPDGVLGTLAKMEREMREIYSLAQSHGAKLSVGVYPWPGQLKYDVVDSLQVKIWREFCESRCIHFYNAFPAFFNLVEQQGVDTVIYDYYFAGDVHFTERGNKVIARTILDAGIK